MPVWSTSYWNRLFPSVCWKFLPLDIVCTRPMIDPYFITYFSNTEEWIYNEEALTQAVTCWLTTEG